MGETKGEIGEHWFGLSAHGHLIADKAIAQIPYHIVYGTSGQSIALLHLFILPTGKRVLEEIQVRPWTSAGRCYYSALRTEVGTWMKPTLWTPEKITATQETLLKDGP